MMSKVNILLESGILMWASVEPPAKVDSHYTLTVFSRYYDSFINFIEQLNPKFVELFPFQVSWHSESAPFSGSKVQHYKRDKQLKGLASQHEIHILGMGINEQLSIAKKCERPRLLDSVWNSAYRYYDCSIFFQDKAPKIASIHRVIHGRLNLTGQAFADLVTFFPSSIPVSFSIAPNTPPNEYESQNFIQFFSNIPLAKQVLIPMLLAFGAVQVNSAHKLFLPQSTSSSSLPPN